MASQLPTSAGNNAHTMLRSLKRTGNEKAQFLQLAKRLALAIGNAIGGNFEVRSQEGGPVVSGEAVLDSEKYLVNISHKTGIIVISKEANPNRSYHQFQFKDLLSSSHPAESIAQQIKDHS